MVLTTQDRVSSCYWSVGGPAAAATSDHFATATAEATLRAGGSAIDALIAAAAVQCVVENGSTTIAGMWISTYYDAASGQTSVVSSKIGPAEAESYDYGVESPEAYGGRGMPVPAWPAGAYRAWELGGRLPWPDLFDAAIVLAEDGFDLYPEQYLRLRMGVTATRTAEGRSVWMRDGHNLQVGERVRQPALARTLRALAEGGPTAFYEGEFAEHFVATSRGLGGRLTMADMARWRERAAAYPLAPVGDYFGYQIATEGALMVYALHLCQAADIGSLDEADAVYAQVRIMEETFHATRQYSPATHDQFVDREYADARIDEVLNRPLRPTSFEQFWSNTNTIVIRDGEGNVVWLTHSVNTPQLFGAGIMVDGAYAARAINATHARTGDLLMPGLHIKLALYRDGKPYSVATSPGFSGVHAPIAFTVGLVQRNLDPLAAVAAPRFALPSPMTGGRQPFESHYPPSVFAMLERRGIPYFECSPMSGTGRISALVIEEERVHAVHDVRGEGTAIAFAP